MTIHLLDYTSPSESFLKIAGFHFSPVRIYLPWYMDPPDFILNDPDTLYSYPAEDLKPEKSFRNILSECLDWLRQHHDKSLIEIIKSGYRHSADDDSIWHIRRLLGNNIRPGSGSREDNAVKWHLVLHLAKEMETQISEANRILFNLRHRPPLLDKSIEKAVSTENLLDDLSGFNHESTLNDTRLSLILDAWLELFGSQIPEKEIICTGSPVLYAHIIEQWSARQGERNIFSPDGVSFRLFNMIDPGSRGERDIITKDMEEKLDEIKSLVCSMAKTPNDNMARLERLCPEYEALLKERDLPAFPRCTVYRLSPLADESGDINRPFFTNLSGRTIILIEEN